MKNPQTAALAAHRAHMASAALLSPLLCALLQALPATASTASLAEPAADEAIKATTSAPTSPPTPALATAPTTEFQIGRVPVTGARRGLLSSQRLLTSVDTLSRELIDQQLTQTTWELFSLVPGVLLTNYNQGTTSGKIALRGFNGEGEVNAVKLLIDGVPANSHNGNMPYLDGVFPLELAAVEVVRGTNDARQGLHAIAGNVQLITRQGGNGTQVQAGAGSFGSRELQLAHAREAEGWSLNLFAGRKHTDGWRDHSDNDRSTVSLRVGHDNGTWRAGLSLRHHRQDADEPGYLTQAMVAADPDQSPAYCATDGGERRVTQLAFSLDGRAAVDVNASARVYLNRFHDDRWVRYSASTSQQERLSDETHLGGLFTLSWQPQVRSLHRFALEGGANLEQQDNRSQRYLTVERVRSSRTRDQHYTQDNLGAFVQAVIEPTATLKLVPGWRIDQFNGHFTNALTDATYAMNGYGSINQPKFSAVWTPLTPLSLYANWGRTFQIGTEAAAYKVPPRTADLAPSVNTGWELGAKFMPTPWLDGRLALWQQTATDEVRRRLNDPSGDSDNIGATRRRGADLQLGLHPTAAVDAWLALTLQRATIVTPDPSAPATVGKEIDHVPHRLWNAGLDWTLSPAWKLGANLQGQSSYYLERSNSTGQYGAYTLLNLGATWTLSPRLSLQAQLRNVADRYSEYVWHDGSQSLHSPGEPRNWGLALRASL